MRDADSAGGRRHGEARPEGLRARAQGDEEEAANLTGDQDGGDGSGRGGAMTTGGGGRRATPAALQEGREGRVRAKLGGGGGGEALPARNRATAHRGRQIGGGKGARAAAMEGGRS